MSDDMSTTDEQGGGGYTELKLNSILLLRLRVHAFLHPLPQINW